MHMSDCLGGYTFFNESFTGPCEKQVKGTNGQLFDWVTTWSLVLLIVAK